MFFCAKLNSLWRWAVKILFTKAGNNTKVIYSVAIACGIMPDNNDYPQRQQVNLFVTSV
jgi:hypothetical protein